MTDSDGRFCTASNDCALYGGVFFLLMASYIAAQSGGECVPGVCAAPGAEGHSEPPPARVGVGLPGGPRPGLGARPDALLSD